jgi:hypothetical protein
MCLCTKSFACCSLPISMSLWLSPCSRLRADAVLTARRVAGSACSACGQAHAMRCCCAGCAFSRHGSGCRKQRGRRWRTCPAGPSSRLATATAAVTHARARATHLRRPTPPAPAGGCRTCGWPWLLRLPAGGHRTRARTARHTTLDMGELWARGRPVGATSDVSAPYSASKR